MDELIRQLEARRAGLVGQMDTILKAPTTEKRDLSTEEQTKWNALKGEIEPLDEQLTQFRESRDREARAAAARAGDAQVVDDGKGGKAKASVSVQSEPTVYGKYSGHSYFLDQARLKAAQGGLYEGAGDGGVNSANERMQRHGKEIDVDLPAREERRARAATRAYEDAFSSNKAETRSLERMLSAGATPFEKRFMSRTDGSGGFFVPPLWLVDEYVPYLRAGREFVNLWRNLPLPHGTDSINIPRVTLGTGTGPQAADGGPVGGRDMTDNFVTSLVRTVAGQMDAAIQLLDQSPVSFDELIFGDLAADYNMQLDGLAMVGSGVNGQPAGVWPAGAISNSSQIVVANANNNAAQTWVNGATGPSLHLSSAQLLSQISRTRLMTPTHWVWHPWVWYMLAATLDSQGRPLVVPGTPSNQGYNQAAVDNDGPVVQGPVGYYYGLPIILDPNVPTTFGGNVAPQISTISNGSFAPSPGSGGNALFTPMLCGRWNDCFIWEGEMRSRTLSEVLSGTLQIRFQLYNYVATQTQRYQSYAAPGQAISFGTITEQSATPANSLLNLTAQGF